MDISLQDGKHYGLKCVELVKSFMGEYEALEPLIFALKNLLKNANLNDPYTVNYILIFLGRTELIWSNSHGRFLFTISTRKQQADKNRRWQHRQTLS